MSKKKETKAQEAPKKSVWDYIKSYASWVNIEKGLSNKKLRKIAEALTAEVMKNLVRDGLFSLIIKSTDNQKNDTIAVKINVLYGGETKNNLKGNEVPAPSKINLPGVIKF